MNIARPPVDFDHLNKLFQRNQDWLKEDIAFTRTCTRLATTLTDLPRADINPEQALNGLTEGNRLRVYFTETGIASPLTIIDELGHLLLRDANPADVQRILDDANRLGIPLVNPPENFHHKLTYEAAFEALEAGRLILTEAQKTILFNRHDDAYKRLK